MADDEKDEGVGKAADTDNGGQDDDIIIMGLDDEDGGDEEEDKGGEGKGEGEGDEGGKKEEAKAAPAPTFRELIDEAKKELKEEGVKETPKDSKHPHTVEELDHAEAQLAEMMEAETISFSKYHMYMKNIAKFRKAMDDEALVLNFEKSRSKQTAEEGLVQWAEANAPEYLNSRKSEYKDAVDWAEKSLGVEKRGDVWLVPGKVGPIMFGVLHKGNQSAKEPGDEGKKETPKKSARDEGYEKGVRDSKARDAELRGRENKVPRGGGSGKEAPATSTEQEVMERLGLTDLKRYRSMKKMGGSTLATVEVK